MWRNLPILLVIDAQREFWAAYREEAVVRVTEAGSVINAVDDPASFRLAVEPVYREQAAQYGDLVERIRDQRSSGG